MHVFTWPVDEHHATDAFGINKTVDSKMPSIEQTQWKPRAIMQALSKHVDTDCVLLTPGSNGMYISAYLQEVHTLFMGKACPLFLDSYNGHLHLWNITCVIQNLWLLTISRYSWRTFSSHGLCVPD